MRPPPRRAARRNRPAHRPRDAPGQLPRARESVEVILRAPTNDEEKRERLVALGLEPTALNAILMGLSDKAAKGDPSAARYLRDAAQAAQEPDAERPPGAQRTLPPDLTALTDEQLRALALEMGDDDAR